MNNLKKILFIIEEKNKLLIFLSLNIINFFLEFLSIISIPIFVAVLLGDKIPKNQIGFIFDYVSESNLLLYASLFVVVSFTLKNLLLTFYAFYLAKFLKKIRSNLSKTFFSYYFKKNVLNSNIPLPSVMARNVSIAVQGFYAYFENLNRFARDTTAVITISLIILLVNLKVGIVLILLFLSVLYLYFKFLRPRIKEKSKTNLNILTNYNKMIIETFEAMKEIKVFQKEKIISNLFNSKVDIFEKNMFFFNIFDKLPRIFLELISIILILFISILYFNYSENILEILPILVLIVVSAIRLIPAFSGISLTLFYLRVYTPNLEAVYDQIKEIRSIKEDLNYSKENLQINYQNKLDINKNFIVIDKISFSYDQTKPLLKNINLSIPKNSSVSIMGPSGCGKSTLQSIIMGLIKPDKGGIFFKNKNILIDYDNWIKKISYVSQKVFLFNDTIEKNICLNFDESKIDQKRLELAIEVAELKEKISNLDNKLKEIVGSDGSKLSGGERQRIALARALYKNSEILFLDEFTSNLDFITESKIINKIKTHLPNITLIMITHKPEIAKKTDLIFKLGD